MSLATKPKPEKLVPINEDFVQVTTEKKKNSKRGNLIPCPVCGEAWIAQTTFKKKCCWCEAKEVLKFYQEHDKTHTTCKKCNARIHSYDYSKDGLCDRCIKEDLEIENVIRRHGL